MDASTRLYSRLGEIPEDPNDPESLAELLVCAFGAFERYYVCWKTKGGEYRQGKTHTFTTDNSSYIRTDGYDLPPALKDWLYPTDGATRDFATLQVVFGRGEEYFASDKDGKLEFKEPEVKKSIEEEKELDKPALRRARTVSFLRPLSDISTRSESSTIETAESRRSSAASSRRASRPPSLSFSRTSSISSDLVDPIPDRSHQTSLLSQWEALGDSTATSIPSTKRSSRSFEPPVVESILEEHSHSPAHVAMHAQPQSTSTTSPPVSEFKVPEGYMLVPINQASNATPSPCTCNCHSTPSPNPTYTNASIQTDNAPSPPRTALRIDTLASSRWSSNSYSAVSQADLSPVYDSYAVENPISLTRSTSYFSKPGYQLGDSLMWGFQSYEPVVYSYQDEFGDEALR
jgi:hypothetical protein